MRTGDGGGAPGSAPTLVNAWQVLGGQRYLLARWPSNALYARHALHSGATSAALTGARASPRGPKPSRERERKGG